MDSFERAAHPEAIFAEYRILVADDNPVNQLIAARMLETLGCRVDVANNGREAVRMHESRAYDLLLMDCHMPELDGYQATTLIRAQEQPPRRTPIIALTASLTDEKRRACSAAGMDDFLPKPIRHAILKDVLGRWLPPAASRSTESPDSPASAYDDELEAVQAVFGSDYPELAALYRRDGAQRIRIMLQASANGDVPQLARIAHLLCGSSASIGAMRLSTLCKQLELCLKSNRESEAGRLLQLIVAEYARIDTRLQSLAG